MAEILATIIIILFLFSFVLFAFRLGAALGSDPYFYTRCHGEYTIIQSDYFQNELGVKAYGYNVIKDVKQYPSEADKLISVKIAPNLEFSLENPNEKGFIGLKFNKKIDYPGNALPNYNIVNTGTNAVVAELIYPNDGDGSAIGLGLSQYKNRYILRYSGEIYKSSKEFMKLDTDNFKEITYFFDKNCAEMMNIQHWFDKKSNLMYYRLCMTPGYDPILKELLISMIISIDLHQRK
jgi:hypothetical protein